MNRGILQGIIAFTLWGLLPIYWKVVSAIDPYQVFLQRVIWSLLFVLFILIYQRRIKAFVSLMRVKRVYKVTIIPAIFVSMNWLCYIWAVNNGYVIETSLGYYINPLVMTLFGALFFKEQLSFNQKIAFGFALTGVLVKTFSYGSVPWVALILASTFAMYGLFKKLSYLDSMMGLAFETLLIGIPALIGLLFIEFNHQGITGNLPTYYWFLIALSGIATATPLLFYGSATKKLELKTLGFLQYIAPTLQLLVGIFLFKEPVDGITLLSFGFIFIALGIFSVSNFNTKPALEL